MNKKCPQNTNDDDEEDIDHSLDEEYEVNKILEQLYTANQDVVDKQLNQKEMTCEKNEGYLRKVVQLQLQLRRIRGQVTQYNKGNTNSAEKQ